MSSNNPTIPPYDWDGHFKLAERLRILDIYSLQLTGRRPMEQGVIQKHLTEEFTRAARKNEAVGVDQYYGFLSQSLQRLVHHANDHAEQSAARGNAIVNYAEDLLRFFPEPRWASLARGEAKMRGDHLADIKTTLQTIGPVYRHADVEYQDDSIFTAAVDSLDISIMQYDGIMRRPPVGATEVFPRVRALSLAKHQEKISGQFLEHALTQTRLIDECLRLATTMNILPDQYKTHLTTRMNVLADVANNLVVNANYTLDMAAELRHAAHLSRDLQRPVFPCNEP